MVPRIGVIGGGKFGLVHLQALSQLQREGKLELVGLADISQPLLEQRASEFNVATYLDHRQLLAEARPHAVTIATPDFLHRDLTLDGLRSGAHVLVEKPMDTSVEGCTSMIDAARARGLLLQGDFHKRYDPYHKQAERAVAEGKLGAVSYGYAHMEDRIEVPRDWFPHWAGDSSPVWFLGVHMFDLLRWIVKSEAKRVYATGNKGKLQDLGVNAYDSIQTHLEFENGANFSVQASWILPDRFEAIVNQGIRIVGAEGVLEIDSQDRGARACYSQDGMLTYNLGFLNEGQDKRGNPVYSGYGVEAIADFVWNVQHRLEGGTLASLQGKYPSGEDGRRVTEIAVAAHSSLSTGEVVSLEGGATSRR